MSIDFCITVAIGVFMSVIAIICLCGNEEKQIDPLRCKLGDLFKQGEIDHKQPSASDSHARKQGDNQ